MAGLFTSITNYCWQATEVVANSTIESVAISIGQSYQSTATQLCESATLRVKPNQALQDHGQAPTLPCNCTIDISVHRHTREVHQVSTEE